MPKQLFNKPARFSRAIRLTAVLHELPYGAVTTAHAHGTRLHFPVNPHTPVLKGRFVPQAPEARVIMPYFHGSGAETAHGGNAWRLMGQLSAHNVYTVGFDQPFHQAGPRSIRMYDVDTYCRWIHQVITGLQRANSNACVVPLGHSFGPTAILGYLSQFSTAVAGAVLLSFGGYSAALDAHYFRVVRPTHERRRGRSGVTDINLRGDLWADYIQPRLNFLKFPAPEVPLLGVIGRQDHLYPEGSLDAHADLVRRHFGSNMTLHLLPKLGHNLWQAQLCDIEASVRDKIINERPRSLRMRLIPAMIVDFLRNTAGLQDDIPLNPAESVDPIHLPPLAPCPAAI